MNEMKGKIDDKTVITLILMGGVSSSLRRIEFLELDRKLLILDDKNNKSIVRILLWETLKYKSAIADQVVMIEYEKVIEYVQQWKEANF